MPPPPIQVFLTTIASQPALRQRQEYVLRVLQVKKAQFTSYDLASDEDAKKLWRRKAPLDKQQLPGILIGGEFPGTFQEFEEANDRSMEPHPPMSLAAVEDLLFAERMIADAHEEVVARLSTVTVDDVPGLAPPPPPPSATKIMLPKAGDSPADVILRIRSKFAALIADGTKNHEYRNYRLQGDVQHVWLWEDDEEVIRWIITIGAPRSPGEVNDPSGVGNDDFDAGLKTASFGYPIYEVYRLPYELDYGILLEDFGIDMADGRQYANKMLVDNYPLASLQRVLPKAE